MSNNSMKRGADYARPRRPDPETITYLRSLPFDLRVATDEINQFLQNETPASTKNNQEFFPQSLAAAFSALDEVQNELASLAGHEQSAEIIETITRLVAPYSETAARMLLQAVSGYALHLATHRYGSHVLQTILELSLRNESSQDLARHGAAPPLSNNLLPSLEQLLVELQQELAPHAAVLSVHICGSHVLRTLLCVIGGVELRFCDKQDNNDFRRGKKKKTKKSSSESNNSNASNPYYMVFAKHDKTRIQSKDDAMEEALQQLVAAISGDTVNDAPGYLQEMACHSSCGPLLSVLLRVLTYREADRNEWITKLDAHDPRKSAVDRHLALFRPEPKFSLGSPAQLLVQRLLCWQDGENNPQEQKWAGKVIYGLAGEQRGSHCLETILHVAPDELYESILRVGDLLSSAPTTLQEYAKDNVSNFVIQTILGTLRSQEQAQSVMECLLPLVESGYIVDHDNHRMSLLWRMVECAVKYKVCQTQLHSSILKGLSRSSSSGADLHGMKECVPLLLGLRKPDHHGDRVLLDVAGARTLFWLLRFEVSLCEPILAGLLKLPADEFELLCTDGLGSRCIVDGILDGPVEESVFSKALAKLTTKLCGRWTALASDRIGHHVVKKLFRQLKHEESREKLVKELVDGKRRMTGNHMSREVMSACLVREYETLGSEEWHRLVKKNLGKENWLSDITRADTGKDPKFDDAAGKRRKRHRTHSGKKARSG